MVNYWFEEGKILSDKEKVEPLIPASGGQKIDSGTKRGRIQMILLLLVCAAPVIASYFTFYVIKPAGGKANIGELVSPVQPFPADVVSESLVGKWTLLVARPASECRVGNDACVSLLYLMRQLRTAMGKEKTRVQLVWLVTDDAKVDPEIEKAYDKELAGFIFVRMPQDIGKKQQLMTWLRADNKESAIHLLDPRAERMMRFETGEGQLDFKKMVKDLEKLLKWNPAGKVGP